MIKYKMWYLIARRELDLKNMGEKNYAYIYIESYPKNLDIKYIFFIFWSKILMCFFSFILFILFYFIFIFYLHIFNLIKFFYITYFIYYRFFIIFFLFIYILCIIYNIVSSYLIISQDKNNLIIEMNLNKNYEKKEIYKKFNELNKKDIQLNYFVNLIKDRIKKLFVILVNIIVNIIIFCYIFKIGFINFIICNLILILYNILLFCFIGFFWLKQDLVYIYKLQEKVCTLFFHYPFILIILAIFFSNNKLGENSMKLLIYAYSDFVLIQLLQMSEFFTNDDEDIICRWCSDKIEELD